MQLVFHLSKSGCPAQRIFNQRLSLGLRLKMLTDMPDARRLLNDDLASIRISLAQNQAEER